MGVTSAIEVLLRDAQPGQAMLGRFTLDDGPGTAFLVREDAVTASHVPSGPEVSVRAGALVEGGVLVIALLADVEGIDSVYETWIDHYNPAFAECLHDLTRQQKLPFLIFVDGPEAARQVFVPNPLAGFARQALDAIATTPPWTPIQFYQARAQIQERMPTGEALWDEFTPADQRKWREMKAVQRARRAVETAVPIPPLPLELVVPEVVATAVSPAVAVPVEAPAVPDVPVPVGGDEVFAMTTAGGDWRVAELRLSDDALLVRGDRLTAEGHELARKRGILAAIPVLVSFAVFTAAVAYIGLSSAVPSPGPVIAVLVSLVVLIAGLIGASVVKASVWKHHHERVDLEVPYQAITSVKAGYRSDWGCFLLLLGLIPWVVYRIVVGSNTVVLVAPMDQPYKPESVRMRPVGGKKASAKLVAALCTRMGA